MKNILKKLIAVKKEMTGLHKSNTNPFFKSKYFDINDIIKHVEPILQNNNLVLLQPLYDNKVYSEIYDVESGEKIVSFIELSGQTDPQKKGSEISYFRRYTLQSLLALEALDDDGNLANKPSTVSKLTDAQMANILKSDISVVKKAFKAIENGSVTATPEQIVQLKIYHTELTK
jgi:hypothetical protein